MQLIDNLARGRLRAVISHLELLSACSEDSNILDKSMCVNFIKFLCSCVLCIHGNFARNPITILTSIAASTSRNPQLSGFLLTKSLRTLGRAYIQFTKVQYITIT